MSSEIIAELGASLQDVTTEVLVDKMKDNLKPKDLVSSFVNKKLISKKRLCDSLKNATKKIPKEKKSKVQKARDDAKIRQINIEREVALGIQRAEEKAAKVRKQFNEASTYYSRILLPQLHEIVLNGTNKEALENQYAHYIVLPVPEEVNDSQSAKIYMQMAIRQLENGDRLQCRNYYEMVNNKYF
jgi:hypothetical protein